MPLTTNFNVSPYYDDYNATKDYYRLLFRPGYGLQARELTQLQTSLQNQINRLGAHLFENGSRVTGGDVTFDNNVKSLKLENVFGGSTVNVYTFNNLLIEGSTSGARGQVVKVEPPTSTDQPLLLIQLLTSESFDDGETIVTLSDEGYQANTTSNTGISGISNAQQDAAIASITEGVFYVDGILSRVEQQTITLSKYSSTPSNRIGLTINESIITTTEDTSLLDNAQGTTNFAAPGANRFKLQLTLEAKDLTSTDEVEKASSERFIELLRVEDGNKTRQVKYSIYSDLEKTLARRTYDESGDYTVRPFGLQLKEHGSNTAKFYAGLEAGKAYVKGFEFETISPTFVEVDKGRSTANVSSYSLSSDYGNKLYISNVKGGFDIKQHEIVDLHCVPTASVNALSNTINALTIYNSTKIGTARIRQFDFEQYNLGTSNTTHDHSIYTARLYDVRVDKTITGEVDSASDSTLFVNLPASITSNVAEAYVGATLVVNTTLGSVSTSDTVTITEYQAEGGIHRAFCNTGLSQNVLSNSTFTISFKLKDVESLIIPHSVVDQSQAANSTHVLITTSADINPLSKYNQDVKGNTFLTDTNRNSLLFPLPYSPIYTLPQGTTYTFKNFEQRGSDTSGTISFSLTATGASFQPTIGTLTPSQAAENFTVVVKSASGVTSGGQAITNGQILSFATGTGRSITMVDTNTVSIVCNTSGAFTAEVYSTIQVANTTARGKTLVVGNTTYISPTNDSDVSRGQLFKQTPNKVPGERDNLFISDVFNLVKVVDSQNTEAFPTLADIANTAKDITSNYTLDTGQRDNFYDHGAIILKPNATPPQGRILAIVDYFTHDSATGYFSIDSYSSDILAEKGYNLDSNGVSQNTFTYQTVPTYISPVTGIRSSLRDVLDFRPVRANANADSISERGGNTVNDISSNVQSLQIITTSNDGGTPDPEFTFVQDIQYYLGRIDKLVLTKDRTFEVIKGVPSLNPIAPPDNDDSMTLYTLNIPAYTFNISDIFSTYIDNKRYTMRDIGKLEKRIENLEYYTSLSLLEKETASRDIAGDDRIDSLFNPQGSRFKNGILVDSFKGHSIGDVDEEDYKNSIDFEKTELRPSFVSDNFKFYYNSASSNNVNFTCNIVTLPFTTTQTVNQPLSSNTYISVNPFNLTTFIGNLKTCPTSDTWYDTSTRPDVLVNLEGLNDSWQFGYSNSGHGSQWNDWSKIWSGIQVNPNPPISVSTLGEIQDNRKNAKLTSQTFTRVGVKSTNIPEAIKKTIGNKVLDVSIVPYMRAIDIQFVGRNLKPNTNVYLYFDETSVTTTPASYINVTGIANTSTYFYEGEVITQGSNTAQIMLANRTTSAGDATLYFNVISSTGAANLAFTTGTIVGSTSGVTATISARVTPTTSTQANTNLAGEVAGTVSIPAGTFRVGERLLRILDTSSHNVATSTTFAEARFAAQGVLPTRESNIISTRLPISRRTEVQSENIYFDVTSRDTLSSAWLNPLSQTFFVDAAQNPNGLFVQSVDLFFRQKATANTSSIQMPVTLQIRPTRNGFPSTNYILPFAEKTLKPEEINVVSDASPSVSNTSHITTFTFDAPVYLPPDEYALVVVTNSNEYQLHTAQNGEVVSGTVRKVTKQPNVGDLFAPQNQGTLEPDSNLSLMFRVNRCEFDTSATGIVVLNSNAVSLSGNTANVYADAVKINSSYLDFSNTTQTYTYVATDTSGTTGNTYSDLVLDETVKLDSRIMLESNTAGDFKIKGILSTNDSKVSPYIDIDRFNVITVENIINYGSLSNSDFYIVNAGSNYNASISTTCTVSAPDLPGGTQATISVQNNSSGQITSVIVTDGGSGYVTTPTVTVANNSVANGTGGVIVVNGETSPKGGNLTTKYITRKVTLEDGFDASDIKIIMNAYKPDHSDIFAYVKVLNADDPQTMDDKSYIKLDQETSSSIYSVNDNDYREYVFKSTNDKLTYNSDNVVYEKFKSFIVKIAMVSTSTIDPPRVKDLRVVALDD